MAYTYNDYSISQGYDPMEEERKRREEQERLANLQSGLPAGTDMPMAPISPDQFQQQMNMPEQMPEVQVAGATQLPQQPMAQPTQVEMTPEAKQVIAQNTTPFTQALQESQNDQNKMWEIYNNSQYTPEQRQIAGAQLSDMMRQEYEKNKATQFIKSATPDDLNKMLNARSTEGSWAKAIMYGLLGMENSARDEAAKLGVGAKWMTQQVYDPNTGKSSNVLYKVRADGLPMEGYNSETGKALTSKELTSLSVNAPKLNIVGGTYVNDKTGEVGRVITDEKTGTSYIQTDTGRKPMAGFRPQSSTGTLEDMRVRKIQEINLALQGKTQEEKMNILRSYNQQLVSQGIPPVQPQEIGLTAPQIGGQVPTPAPSQPRQKVAPAAAAPVAPVPLEQQPTVAPTVSPFAGAKPELQATIAPEIPPAGLGGRPTLSQIEAQRKAQEKISQAAGEVVSTSADTQNMLNSISKVEKILDSGKHNIGSAAAAVVGRGPIAQTIGEQFETTDAKNTKLILDTVNKLAADGLKSLGANPSNADMRFWTENKPNGSTDPEVMREWIKSRAEDLKRRLSFAEKQVGTGGAAGVAPPAQQIFPEKTINGVTYIYDGKGWKKK